MGFLRVSGLLSYSQERAFLGLTTLKELVMKRPQGPTGTEDFLEALLEVTTSDIELVSTALYCTVSPK